MKRARPSDSEGEEAPRAYGLPPKTKETLTLRPGYQSRPLWVDGDGCIVLEAFHEHAAVAQDFCVQIAEPRSRPVLMHEFQITLFSIYAAISVGLTVNEVLRVLDMFSKTALARSLVEWLRRHGEVMGKVRMVLREDRYFVESVDRSILQQIFSNPDVRAASLEHSLRGRSFEVDPTRIEKVKMACHAMEVPLMEEYDFHNDTRLPDMHTAMRASTVVRPYQQRALSRVFSSGLARSGVIVLPCGAGKTLCGIIAATTMKKRTLVLTTTAVAVDQWRRQFLQFTHIAKRDVYVLTAESKSTLEDVEERGCVLISTYSMLGYAGKRASQTQYVLNQVRDLTWGLLIVDEVQVMPAKTFRTVATIVKAHCKVGLTATLVREDNLVEDLQYLIGPKLFEANWQQLQDQGYLAKVQCVEVWCDMTKQFYKEYLLAKDQQDYMRQRALFTCNPSKLQVCEYLLHFHEHRGDKVIVFSDNIVILERFARKLKRHFICGKVEMHERMQILRAFQTRSDCNTIFLSKVGDNAIDLPAANVVIQISSHFGSRRQEAQRLGRILRPKSNTGRVEPTNQCNAYFYSLVSNSTQEMYYASRRQQFLVEQGYAYRVVRDMTANIGPQSKSLVYSSPEAQKELMRICLESSSKAHDLSDDDVALFAETAQDKAAPPIEQRQMSLAELSRGDISQAIQAKMESG